MNQELEQIIFHYILSHPDLCEKCRKEYFSLTYIGELFQLAEPFVQQYHSKPSAEQMYQLITMSNLSPEIKEYLNFDVISQFWQISDSLFSYTDEWLLETTKAFLSWQTLVSGVKGALAYIKTVQNDVSIDNYKDVIDKARYKLNQGTAVEFVNTGDGVSLYDPEAHKTKELKKWSTGFSFLDRGSKGGYWAGSLWVFLGAPKAGKSRLLQNLCAESIKRGDNCAYASFELQEEIVTQRIGSNLFSIKMDDYEAVASDSNLMTQHINKFLNDNPMLSRGFLDIKSFPTSAFSVPELEDWLLKEEERLGIKFKNVYVDYINIMKNWRNPNSENTYMKIKQIAEDLRAMAMRCGWCVISVTQTKQAFFNASDIDMTSASESSALSATVDFMGGIITDVMMQAQHFLFLKTILSRVSPKINERKKFLIEENFMRLVESTEEIIKDEDLETINKFVNTSKKIVQGNAPGQINLTNSIPLSQPQIQSEISIMPTQKVTVINPNLSATEFTGGGLEW